MPRELHSSTLTIDQMADLVGDDAIKDRENIIRVDRLPNQDYLDELQFNEEPVTIRLEPSTDKNASGWYPVWVNGKGAEVLMNGRWIEFGYLPVGKTLVVKRKYVEVIIRAKLDTVTTDVLNRESENPDNIVRRFTSAVHSFSILHDANPLGAAWATELRRRYM
jgi:hypothetical protein